MVHGLKGSGLSRNQLHWLCLGTQYLFSQREKFTASYWQTFANWSWIYTGMEGHKTSDSNKPEQSQGTCATSFKVHCDVTVIKAAWCGLREARRSLEQTREPGVISLPAQCWSGRRGGVWATETDEGVSGCLSKNNNCPNITSSPAMKPSWHKTIKHLKKNSRKNSIYIRAGNDSLDMNTYLWFTKGNN